MVVLTTMRTRRIALTKEGRVKEIRVFDADLKTGKVKIVFKGPFSGAAKFLKDVRNTVDRLNL